MQIALINPRLSIQKWDFLGSGVPYWPVELAILAAALREAGDDVAVVDLFGEDPSRLSDAGDHLRQGLAIDDVRFAGLLDTADAFVLYAISYMSLSEQLDIVRYLRQHYPQKIIAVLENSQAVTAYDLTKKVDDFFQCGASHLVCGEALHNLDSIRAKFRGEVIALPNVIDRDCAAGQVVQRLKVKNGIYPVPAWDLFPVKGYWSLPYAHGPKRRKYFPILTTRGCPYPCDFCVIPETNDRGWRARSVDNIVDEILALRDKFGIIDFHVEDVNPTVNFIVWEQVCQRLIALRAGISFYFVSGTKAETVPLDKVELLAKAGCRYISISPESGDVNVMRRVGKKFDYGHGEKLIAACKRAGIRTQACFITGHPDESDNSIKLSAEYLRRLLRSGLDEAAIFVVAPLPGSRIFADGKINLSKGGIVSFSPAARGDYDRASSYRKKLIALFFREKLLSGLSLWGQGLRALFRKPETKIENIPWRLIYVLWAILKMKIIDVASKI